MADDAAPVQMETPPVDPGVAPTLDVLPGKALDQDMIGPGLSLISRTGNGLSHAYTRLALTGKQVNDVDALRQYPHLRHIDLSNNAIPHVSSLQHLDYLISVNVSGNKISTLPAFFDNFKYLQILDASRNLLSSFEMQKGPLMVSLNINNNMLKETLALKDFPELTQLEAKNNKLTVVDVQGAPKIEKLYLSGNNITTVDGLSQCMNLTHLYLRDNLLRSLGSFTDGGRNLPTLTYLNLRGNQISRFNELDKLKALTSLKVLILRDNPIAEEANYRLEVLYRLPQLERIDKDLVTEDDRDELELYKTNRPTEPTTDDGLTTNREIESELENDTEVAQGEQTEVME